jgi:DnaD/phage-associated family protein
MDTVARNWAEDGITTVEAARKTSADRNSTVFSIKKALGISGRDLVESELNYIDKWTNTYSLGLDIICEACTRTISATNRPSFKYADTILTKWYKSSVKSLDDIAKLDEDFQANNIAKVSAAKARQAASKPVAKPKAANNKFNNFPQRECNFEALEKKLLGY